MITQETLTLFQSYKGDVDAFAHGKKADRKILSDADFYLINSLLDDIHLINKNLASKEYSDLTESKIKASCDTEDTIRKLKQLSMLMRKGART